MLPAPTTWTADADARPDSFEAAAVAGRDESLVLAGAALD